MAETDPRPHPLIDRIEEAIVEIEEGSAAEVVVTLATHSGRYTDIDLLWGVILATVKLAVVIWSPIPFDPNFVLLNVLLLFAAGYFLSRWSPALRRILLSRERMAEQCRQEALQSAWRQGVDRTRERTGLLLHLSRLERRLTLLADRGLQERIADQLWDRWQGRYGWASSTEELQQNLMELLQAVKDPLARQLPKAADDINELPDRPQEVA